MTKARLNQLGKTLWDIADQLRGAMESCEASGHAVSDHFRGVTKLIVHGKGEESVVKESLTTAADGNLSENPTGSRTPKLWRPAMDKQLQALQHNLEAAVQRAMETCAASGHWASDHFRGVTKMVVHCKGGLHGVNDEATQ